MSEWKPIETAPKDGTQVLLYLRGGAVIIAPSMEPQPISYDTKKRLAKEGIWPNHYEYEPTHWMPLPEPPVSNPKDYQA